MVDTIHKTLIIRFSSVGDIILSSLLLRVFRKRFPNCRIDYLVKAEFADLVRHNPNVTHVMEFPVNGGFKELRKLKQSVSRAGYDLVIDIHGSLRSWYLTFGIPSIVRMNKRRLARFFLVKLKWNVYGKLGGAPGVAERYLETVEQHQIGNDGCGLETFVPADVVTKVNRVLLKAGIDGHKPVIGICPSARHANKMWLQDRFAELGIALAGDGATILLFGKGEEERNRCEAVKHFIEQQSPVAIVINLAGNLSLLETGAAMDRCSVVLTNDSGLMHLAASRKRKVVAIFGPTVKELGFFPYGTDSIVIENSGLSCRPCTHIGLPECPKKHFKCMKDIPTSEVLEAARRMLDNPGIS
jgi:lipopolysaccharide heptosyltransferase II